MSNQLERWLFPILDRRKHLPEDELYRFVLMLAVAIVACLMHVFFAVFFVITSCPPLAVSHALGIPVFVVSFFLLQRGRYDLSGVLLAAMIVFSTIATIYEIGGANFSLLYQFTVLSLLMVIPFVSRRLPLVLRSMLPVIMVASYLLDLYHQPLYDIGVANEVLTVINILINALSIVLLYLLERSVRTFVSAYQKNLLRELQNQANLDPLTSLYNRRYAQAYFDQIQRQPPDVPLCVAIVDADDFKQINDTYGHEVGDEALKAIAQKFIQYTRKTDLAIRWGGEEFLLVLYNTAVEDAFGVLDDIRRLIAQTPLDVQGHTIALSITIGLAPLDPGDIQKSLETCDRLLYYGKAHGKNQVVL